MPAKRLPWYKVWAEHTDHEKICRLTDGEYRTWHTIIAKAAQQPIRWRFASVRHAAIVTSRPERHIKALLDAGLLDNLADGVWVHDWHIWQRWTPDDDTNDSRRTHEGPSRPLERGEGRGETGEGRGESPRPIRSRESGGSAASDRPAKVGFDEANAREYAEGKGYSGEKVDRMLEKFLAHHESVGWKRAAGVVIRDRQKAWVRWVQNELDYHPPAKQDYRPMKVVY